MPRLNQTPRSRRRRIVGTLALFLSLVGGALATATARAWARSGALSVPLAVTAVSILLLGLVGITWARWTKPEAEGADRAGRRPGTPLDGLPPGAFRRGSRIGLRSQALWTHVLLPVFGTLMLLFGGLITLAAGEDTEMLIGGCGVLALGVLMFWLRYRIGGTVLWLDPEGLTVSRPHRRLTWGEISRTYLHGQQLCLELRRGTEPAGTVRIPIGVLEITPDRLVELLAHQRNLALGLPHGTPLPWTR